jgi:hypothetical protein
MMVSETCTTKGSCLRRGRYCQNEHDRLFAKVAEEMTYGPAVFSTFGDARVSRKRQV